MSQLRREEFAVDLSRLVRVVCRHGLDTEVGWVVGVGAKWLLLQCEWDAGLDGWVAIRSKVISALRGAKAGFVMEALKLNGERPTEVGGLDLDRTASLLRAAGTGGRLLGIVERRHNDLRVGQLREVRSRRLTINEIDTSARWTTEPHHVQLGDIAKVEFGGRYLDRLAAVVAANPLCR